MDNGQIISAHSSHNNPKNLPDHYSGFLNNDHFKNQDSSQTMMSTEDSSQEIKRIWNIFGKPKGLPSYGVKLIKVKPEKDLKTTASERKKAVYQHAASLTAGFVHR